MNEIIWKPMKNYEDAYEVSNNGDIRTIEREIKTNNGGHFIQKSFNKKFTKHYKGYLVVNLKNKGKKERKYVHRIIAENFIANPLNLPQVNHKNENKEDNRVENLEWCTNEYNERYGTKNKRSGEKRKGKITHNAQKVKINDIIYPSISNASKKLGISEYYVKIKNEFK